MQRSASGIVSNDADYSESLACPERVNCIVGWRDGLIAEGSDYNECCDKYRDGDADKDCELDGRHRGNLR